MQSLLRARVELFYSAVEQTPARVLPTFRQEETLLIKSSTCLHLAIALHLRLYTSTMQTETSMSLCRVHRTCASNKGTSLNRPLIRSKPQRTLGGGASRVAGLRLHFRCFPGISGDWHGTGIANALL